MKPMTTATKPTDLTHSWHVIDAKGQILGRLATDIALKLMGKGKPHFVRNLDCGDNVVVVNASSFVTTGKKEADKVYGNYSGYPGGLKQKPLWKVKLEHPTEPLRRAVYGMLPKNKLRDRLITRLYLYEGDTHPHQKEITEQKGA